MPRHTSYDKVHANFTRTHVVAATFPCSSASSMYPKLVEHDEENCHDLMAVTYATHRAGYLQTDQIARG